MSYSSLLFNLIEKIWSDMKKLRHSNVDVGQISNHHHSTTKFRNIGPDLEQTQKVTILN